MFDVSCSKTGEICLFVELIRPPEPLAVQVCSSSWPSPYCSIG